MNMFKLISSVTGVVITLSSAYSAQKKIVQLLNDEVDEEQHIGPSRLGVKTITIFATSIIIGGIISHIINRTY